MFWNHDVYMHTTSILEKTPLLRVKTHRFLTDCLINAASPNRNYIGSNLSGKICFWCAIYGATSMAHRLLSQELVSQWIQTLTSLLHILGIVCINRNTVMWLYFNEIGEAVIWKPHSPVLWAKQLNKCALLEQLSETGTTNYLLLFQSYFKDSTVFLFFL